MGNMVRKSKKIDRIYYNRINHTFEDINNINGIYYCKISKKSQNISLIDDIYYSELVKNEIDHKCDTDPIKEVKNSYYGKSTYVIIQIKKPVIS